MEESTLVLTPTPTSFLTHLGRDDMAATLADNTFKFKFFSENAFILIMISLKFAPKGPINDIPALVQIMAWRWPGDKPSSEPMMVSLLMHIYASLSLSELKKYDFMLHFMPTRGIYLNFILLYEAKPKQCNQYGIVLYYSELLGMLGKIPVVHATHPMWEMGIC